MRGPSGTLRPVTPKPPAPRPVQDWRTLLVVFWLTSQLLGYEELWAAAGTPRHVFPIAPQDLLRITGGTVAPLRA